MGLSPDLLLNTLRRPETAYDLSLPEWDLLLSQGSGAGVLSRLLVRLEHVGVHEAFPSKVSELLGAARVAAEENRLSLLWELNRLAHALSPLGVTSVALKGAAYALAALPPSRGRVCSDVDILVAKSRLSDVEAALAQNGWEAIKFDAYDQHYYRTWMHELPPLLHKRRDTLVDVHHALAPETSRYRVNSEAILRSASPVEGSSIRVLAPTDMVLHSATHFLQDAEHRVILRDLLDMDDLLRHFSSERFWKLLLERAQELGATRALFYASRYSRRILGTPIPDDVRHAIERWGPPRAVLPVMDAFLRRILVGSHDGPFSLSTRAASGLVYCRSHWLRMPPLLLGRHLMRKGWRRFTERVRAEDDAELPGLP